MSGCCQKIEAIKELFDLFHEGDDDMDTIDLVIRIERIVFG